MTTHSEHSNSKPTLETILNHRSIRKFTNQPIDAATFEPVSYTHLTLPTIYSV